MRLKQSPADVETDFISSRTSDSTFHFGHSSISTKHKAKFAKELNLTDSLVERGFVYKHPLEEKLLGNYTMLWLL